MASVGIFQCEEPFWKPTPWARSRWRPRGRQKRLLLVTLLGRSWKGRRGGLWERKPRSKSSFRSPEAGREVRPGRGAAPSRGQGSCVMRACSPFLFGGSGSPVGFVFPSSKPGFLAGHKTRGNTLFSCRCVARPGQSWVVRFGHKTGQLLDHRRHARPTPFLLPDLLPGGQMCCPKPWRQATP